MKKVIKFLKEVWAELKRVSWPTRKELGDSTIIVIVVSVLAGLFLGLFDIIFSRSILVIIRLLGS